MINIRTCILFLLIVASCSNCSKSKEQQESTNVTTTTPVKESGSAAKVFGDKPNVTCQGARLSAQEIVGFQPSNVTVAVCSPTLSVQIDANCTMGTNGFNKRGSMSESCATSGGPSDLFGYVEAEQDDSFNPRVSVVSIKSLDIKDGVMLYVSATMPVVIVSEGDVNISGKVVVGGYDMQGGSSRATAGGQDVPGIGAFVSGDGNGGGGKANERIHLGPGGGGYCGFGGAGKAGGDNGGKTYGSPELTPLLAGSSGGRGHYGLNALGLGLNGYGGGAIQLVSKTKITISKTGQIIVAGRSGPINEGGGSGGAILLEAPSIEVAGVLSANGGAGGTNDFFSKSNESGKASLEAAKADTRGKNRGGDGSSATNPNGMPGTYDQKLPREKADGDYGGGGGGGAGRIRINTADGTAKTDGATISPALTTACATLGKIKK